MSATTIALAAFMLMIVRRWADNRPAGDVKTIVEIVVAVMFIAFLDRDPTRQVAMGFALLFLAVAILGGKNSPGFFEALNKATSGPKAQTQTLAQVEAKNKKTTGGTLA